MGRGSYNGGGTLLPGTFAQPAKDETKLSRKERERRQKAPGLHVLTEESRKEVLQKVRESRRLSQARDAARPPEVERRRNAFAKFKSQMKAKANGREGETE